VNHWTEPRVRAHVGICVLAYTMLTLVELLLEKAGIRLSGEAGIKELAAITRHRTQSRSSSLLGAVGMHPDARSHTPSVAGATAAHGRATRQP